MDDYTHLNLKKELLKKQACFSQLTPNETETLATLLTEVRFVPGETIVVEGDPVDSVYLIVKGSADVRVSEMNDNKIEFKSVANLSAGESIGLNETGFYSLSGKRTATVVAITDLITFRMSLAEFHGFALANSHVNEVMRINAENMLGAK